MKRRFMTAMIASVLLAQANGVFAETSATPNALEGSDTFNAMMDSLLIDLALVDGNGIESYNGIGSSGGERQMIGNPNLTNSEPACTDTDGGENVGCQEVAPMSREMGAAAVCAAGNAEAVGQAEGIAVCKDGLAVITDNDTYGMYADDADACMTFNALADTSNAGSPPSFPDRHAGDLADTGTLPISGYALGAGFAPGTEWKDVLRVVYTGCLQGDGDCMTANGTGNTSSGVPSRKRTQRCDSPIRRELMSNWRHLMEGTACGDLCEVDLSDGMTTLPGHRADDAVDDTGLKHAYRRDDVSGTTGAFLEMIGIRQNLTGRAKVTATALESVGAAGCSAGLSPATAKLITPIPEHFAFCDGGNLENWAPDCQSDTIDPIGGDPVRKNCSEGDDLCGPDQKAAVVQAIKSTRGSNSYPTHQCSRGQFAKRNYLASPHNVCPDGSKPSAGQCKLPFFAVTGGGQNFDCLNPFNSRPSTVSGTTDGRTYNVVMRSTAGLVDQPTATTVEVASWRMNMATMALSGTQNIFGKAYVAGDYVCREVDATRNIGCIVSNSTCSMGFAGRETAYTTANNFHLTNEPFLIKGVAPTDPDVLTGAYGLARNLWFNAIGGMEQITAQCLARGDTADFCAEQKRIADEFWGASLPGNLIAGLCEEVGYTPLPRTSVFCKGPSATCGAANSADPATSMTQCVPN